MTEKPAPKISTDTPTYGGVSVDHPSIVSTIKTMATQGKKVPEIMRVTGMPAEVVRRHAPHAKES
jgi:hypothetical protein